MDNLVQVGPRKIDPAKDASFSSHDWDVLRNWLAQEKDAILSRMCDTKLSHDETNVLRGRVLTINTILSFEQQAAKSRLIAAAQE